VNPHHIVTKPAKWHFRSTEPPHSEGLVVSRGSLFLRVVSGVAEHFPIRVGEWIMGGAMVGFGWVLWLVPDSFDRSTSLYEMGRIADESTWASLAVTVGFLRLCALFINGTFRETFRYSPHLRGMAAVLACFIWGQITLSILVSYYLSGGILTGFVAYGTLMLLDMWNLFRAWADVGHYKVNPG
jgi:hypothetical protein